MMSQSSSVVPSMKLKRRVLVGIMVYLLVVFGVITTLKEEPPSNAIEKKTTARTRVLIARPVSPTEIKNVIDDLRHFNSYDSFSDQEKLAHSKTQCDRLRQSQMVDPFTYGSQTFPNHIICDSSYTLGAIEVTFLFFARNGEVAKNISDSSNSMRVKSEVIDVSGDSIKVWNWIYYLNEVMLFGYDYVWMVDGDILLRSINWVAFWQQMLLFRPKIAQPSLIGTAPGKPSSWHPILRHQEDSRLLAAETALVELGAPIFHVETWLGYRERIAKHTELIERIKVGGENWLDASWCHYARSNMIGEQMWPSQNLVYNSELHSIDPKNESSVDTFKNRSCVVLYQTPLVHANKKALKKTYEFRLITGRVMQYLKENFQVQLAGETAYEVITTPIHAYADTDES